MLALDILFSNLHEFGCPVQRKAYMLIEEVGRQHVSEEYPLSTWEILKPQIVD